MDAVSELIKDVIFIDSDFIKSMKNIETGVCILRPICSRKIDSFVNYGRRI